jgi:hypothetical protein
VVQRTVLLPERRHEDYKRLESDVARLRAQVDFTGGDWVRSPLMAGVSAVCELYALIFDRRLGSDASGDETLDLKLLRLYWGIGRMIHEAMAVDWLAREYGLLTTIAWGVLSGELPVAGALEPGPVVPSTSLLRGLGKTLPLVGPRYRAGYEQGRRGGARSRRLVTDTDLLVVSVVQGARRVLGGGTGWSMLWSLYERVRTSCLAAEPELYPKGLRTFSNWRAFRVAHERAQSKAARTAA